jgi:hypothetical protein
MARFTAAASVAALLLLSGCATTDTQWNSATMPTSSTIVGSYGGINGRWDNPDNTFICEIERPTGTLIAYRVCRSITRMEAERRAADEYRHDFNNQAKQVTR